MTTQHSVDLAALKALGCAGPEAPAEPRQAAPRPRPAAGPEGARGGVSRCSWYGRGPGTLPFEGSCQLEQGPECPRCDAGPRSAGPQVLPLLLVQPLQVKMTLGAPDQDGPWSDWLGLQHVQESVSWENTTGLGRRRQ